MVDGLKEPMSDVARRAIGCYLVAVGLLMLVLVPWAWSVAWRANESESGEVPASFLGLDFTASAPATLLVMVVLMAVIGSITVMTLVFAARAGHGTLEQTYLWWYVTRPISAAGLGILVYMFLVAGFFDFATIEDGSAPALILAAGLGALSGLFTDQVLDRVRWVLGLSVFTAGTAPADWKQRRDEERDVGLTLLDEAQERETAEVAESAESADDELEPSHSGPAPTPDRP